uniref:RING-type domain-containing protein n=1 Tax=Panagrolaimus sp. PS1159 TaxID=55785 RepID=A0AC35GAA2_9BILA
MKGNTGIINAGGRRIERANMKRLDDHKLKQLARCCICFENYSLNTRAPVCGPCGHSFCTVCIRKLIHGNLVCCCICRKVTFFGPKELGKNIQLLDILEHLGLLDPDEEVATQNSSSSNFPENVIEAVEDKDLVKFFDFCF